MFLGGSAIVIAFLVGAVTGRAVQPERSPEFVASSPERGLETPVTKSESVPPTATPLPSNAPPSEAAASGNVGTAAREAAKSGLPAFNAKAAKSGIDRIASRLKACRHAGEPSGPASVVLTFSPAGRVSNATVATAGYSGTRTETCIVERLREVRVPEFAGAPVTVKRSVAVR
jgi:hypothetical protein